MNAIKKNRIEIMKKVYEMISLNEEINECIMAIYGEIEKDLDNKLDYGIKSLKGDQWVKLGELSKETAKGKFIDDENIIIEFNRFIKDIEDIEN